MILQYLISTVLTQSVSPFEKGGLRGISPHGISKGCNRAAWVGKDEKDRFSSLAVVYWKMRRQRHGTDI
jgi:hypothetical protein